MTASLNSREDNGEKPRDQPAPIASKRSCGASAAPIFRFVECSLRAVVAAVSASTPHAIACPKSQSTKHPGHVKRHYLQLISNRQLAGLILFMPKTTIGTPKQGTRPGTGSQNKMSNSRKWRIEMKMIMSILAAAALIASISTVQASYAEDFFKKQPLYGENVPSDIWVDQQLYGENQPADIFIEQQFFGENFDGSRQ
ncbi:MAG: hypothetical protein KJ622_05675 [Alphaproteobacteria bacterium]|nr:hypothetical protein [Alphaproteobacteria bacterium]